MTHIDDIIATAAAQIAAVTREPVEIQIEDPQPTHGSIVLISSNTGTAAQRHYSDGLWHTTTGGISTFEGLFVRRDGRERSVWLVWSAPAEEEER